MKINVSLYGGKSILGGRETPLEADEIFCDVADTCSFYKENKCLKCRSFMAPDCKFGKVKITTGYTSRAKKYYSFKNKYTSDEVYSKLKYPTTIVAFMNNHLYLNTKYLHIRKKKENETGFSGYQKTINNYVIMDRGFMDGGVFFPIEDVTIELLHSVLESKPQAMMGGTITAYKEKVVPDLLIGLKQVVPEIYTKLIKEYPQYDITPNYIGKKAYINSLKPNTEIIVKNTKWLYDGEYISTKDYNIGLYSPWFSEGASKSDVKIKVNDKMLFEITDNNIVDENTKFEN